MSCIQSVHSLLYLLELANLQICAFVWAQGLPLLVGMVEEGGVHDDGALTAIALPCLLRLLECPLLSLPRPQLCRVLASLGLGHRLAKSLRGLHSLLPKVPLPHSYVAS